MPTRGSAVARRETAGGLLVAAAAVQFGIVVVLGKIALRRGLPVEAALSIRFGVGAVVLASALVLLGRPILAAPGERLGAGLLALFGYAVEATLFFQALRRGTAAAVTLLFFLYPVIVTVGTWILGRGRPNRRTFVALAAAVTGAAIVVGTGAGFEIERAGAAFAFGAAATYSAYLIGADAVLRRTHALTSALWVSAGASVGLFVYAELVGSWRLPHGIEWAPIVGMGFASAGAFVCLMAGIQRLGAVRTAIVSALEPLSASALGRVVLGEPVTWGIVLGGGLILAGAIAASLSRAATPQEQQIP